MQEPELTVEEQITQKFEGAAPEAPVEEAETAAAPEVAEEAPVEPELLLGKYKDAEALGEAYKALETKFKEQGNEVGQLRQLRDEFAQLRDELTSPPAYDPNSIDDFLATNPQQIQGLAEKAIADGDGYLYQRALAAWGELDQVGAMDFHARQVSAAQVAEVRKEIEPLRAAQERVQIGNEFAQAFEAQTSKHPDFAQVMNSVSNETLEGFPPEVLAALQTGDAASKERVLETLYRWTKTEQAGQITDAVAQSTQQVAEQARAERTNAAVASAGVSQDRVPEQKSGADAWREQFQNSNAFKKAAGLA